MKNYKCVNCETEYFSSNTVITICPSCSSDNFYINDSNDTDIVMFGQFDVDRQSFLMKLKNWLIEGNYTPDDIEEKTDILECTQLYIPYYKFQFDIKGNWNASSGYNKKEKYYEYDESSRKRVEKTRIVTDWSPSNGIIDKKLEINSIASSMIDYDNELYDFLDSIKINSLYEGRNLTEPVFEMNTYSTKDVYKNNAENKLIKHINKIAGNMVPGDVYKDLKISPRINLLKSQLFYKPVWIATCVYKEELFKFLTSGNDGNCQHVIGEKPVDQKRKQRVRNVLRPFKIFLGLTIFSLFTMFGGNDFLTDYSGYSDNIIQTIIEGSIYTSLVSIILLIFTAITGFGKRHQLLNESKRKREYGNSDLAYTPTVSKKSRTVATYLCLFFGYLGIHRFYTGNIVTGLLWLFTLGLGGVGYAMDLLIIVLGKFTDKDKNQLSKW